MITGVVNSRHEILIRLPVRDSRGREQEVETILDTGFTGSLTLPTAVTAGLGLSWRSRSYAVLANGSIEPFDLYAATVIWDGTPRPILVQAIDAAPLLGMALLVGHDLRARVVDGGVVQIEVVP
jgi:clan AA aspartic protease